MAVEAMKLGAVDFLPKPFRDQDLLDCVQKALDRVDAESAQAKQDANVKAQLDSLTPREREVLGYLMDGAANKVIAIELNISPRTVEIHRARVVEKMGVRTLPDLVKRVLPFQ